MEKVIRYQTDKAIVEVHFAELSDEEREKQHKKLEQALVKFYMDVIKSGVEWNEN